ncbi:S8 family serine peptidase [Spongiivirga sp. MCCC 1A20706]|uniref:S8 family serine peptidase n=1 Tax=Spongiivirga sp. MCCC 1A20706 TaxID=3160963 RepID=UPI00397749D0
MKLFLVFMTLFCVVWSGIGQQDNPCKKWSHFEVFESGVLASKKQSSYFLQHTHGTEAIENYQLIRRLDSNHAIVVASVLDDNLVQVNDLWKLSPNIDLEDVTQQIFVIRVRDNTRLLANMLRVQGVEILKQNEGRLVVACNNAIISHIVLPNDNVTYVGKEAIITKKESVVSDLNPTINGINALKDTYPDLLGANITVGIKDNQFNPDDIDLIGKRVDSPIISETIDNHATDMSTIISGLGNSSATSTGVATGTMIFLSDFNEVFPDDQTILNNAQVQIQNHSYGTEIESFYGELAAEYDDMVAVNPQMLHVFSSGNSGGASSENGTYAGIEGFANLTGNFKMAKNTLLVGAINELNQPTDFSSKGPAYDGRLKPELVAYSFEGTSNTAALVSGAALLVSEAYENETANQPTAAMLKSVLINTATDVGAKGPDFSTGYGSLNAKKAIDLVKKGTYISDIIANNETKNYSVTVPENVKHIKVTLVWTDPAASPNDNIALVNDLDLSLIDSRDNEILPWVLNTDSTAATLQLPAIRAIDNINTVEQLTLETAAAGDYFIKVSAGTLTEDQAFSVSYYWESEEAFSWTYPLENENYPYNGDFVNVVRWSQTFPENTLGSIAVRYNNEAEWQLIDNAVTVSDGFYQWDPPVDYSGIAQLRMTIDDTNFLSEVFSISRSFNVQVSLNCEATVELNWPNTTNAAGYEIYNLQEKQMQAIAQVQDTVFSFDKTGYVTTFFAVAPVFTNDRKALRSPTISYQDFGERCYFDTISAELSDDQNGIEITSQLSSLSGIEDISILKILADGQEIVIENLSGFINSQISVVDNDPDLGQNRYKFLINTINGGTIESDIVSAFFFTEKDPYLLFPNPVIDKGVNVYSNKSDDEFVVFELYDLKGRLLIQREITSDRDFVNTETLQSGVYLYSIESSKKNYKSGKVIIGK